MDYSFRYRWFMLLVCAVLLMAQSGAYSEQTLPAAEKGDGPNQEQTWIIQWAQEVPEDFWPESVVLTHYEGSHVTVARPKPGRNPEDWIRRVREDKRVESFQLNQKVKALKAPNDPLLSNQKYLEQIHAESAWDAATNNEMVIAVVDTGVDLDHPDLAGRLVQGINLVNRGAPPQDDNGHGTSVAGVIAAAADNDKGTAGLLWNTRIMPVKALEGSGNGDEAKLGEGIRYAVQNGAKIVVLSLGLNKFSSYMEKIAQEAEEQGVLLVAASGNEGNAVKYPAAYDSVLAVGGVGVDNRPMKLSNSGPELDLVAPWVVFTTSLNGSYDYKDGTSMAAPQVAAVAALVWSIYPGMKPAELRNHLRQTAQDLGTRGWDELTGYGLLRADRALHEAPKPDIYESNDRQAAAVPISSNKNIGAFLDSGEEDWFYWDAPYDGYAHYKLSGAEFSLDLTHLPESSWVERNIGGEASSSMGALVEVKKGRNYVKVSSGSGGSSSYSLNVDFEIYQDAFEDNDRQYKAYMLPGRSQLLVGTFSHYQDQDWYSMPIDQPGTLKLKITPDTARMDPVLSIIRKGGREIPIDHNGDGLSEYFQMEVTPGQYYIKISNISEYPFPVVGEYALDIHLATSYEDPYEPNNKSYQATLLSFGENYFGVIDPESDSDWYRFRLDGDSLLHLEVNPLPEAGGFNVQLLDVSLRPRSAPFDNWNTTRWTAETQLPAGTYYLKVTSAAGIRQQMYGLRAHAQRMVAGFSDIYGHWAEESLVGMIQKGFVEGYGGHQLYPDRPITRAEAAVLLDRILRPAYAPPPDFGDVSPDHWAYPAIARLNHAGIVSGYSESMFSPDRNISRMEMMTMLANAAGKKGIPGNDSPFTDVHSRYWGAAILRQLKLEGWAQGYDDGSFRPERLATRAELMFIVNKLGI